MLKIIPFLNTVLRVYELILLYVTSCFCGVTMWQILELSSTFHSPYQFWTNSGGLAIDESREGRAPPLDLS